MDIIAHFFFQASVQISIIPFPITNYHENICLIVSLSDVQAILTSFLGPCAVAVRHCGHIARLLLLPCLGQPGRRGVHSCSGILAAIIDEEKASMAAAVYFCGAI